MGTPRQQTVKRLLLRADASTTIGTGHVMRCIALAQAWQDMGGEVTLLSDELPLALAQRASVEGIQVAVLHEVSDGAQETAAAAAVSDWCVIDGYHFDEAFCDQLVRNARHVMVIDDVGHLRHYGSELVLNQNINASPTMYAAREAGTGLLLGCKHALLRREFRLAPVTRNSSSRCEKVLVTLGGSDPDNVTLKVIEALLPLSHLRARVVVGPANIHRQTLEKRCDAAGGRIELLAPVENMVPLMDWADLAISAGGTSVLELASRGVPAMLISIADNQRAISGTLHELGVMWHAGWHEDVTKEDLTSAIRELSFDACAGQRDSFAARGRELVDGRGAMRVAREMMARDALSSVRVRLATGEDARRVFEWANDPVTRSVSFQQGEIQWVDHASWFARKLEAPACRLFIGEDMGGHAIGMVRFDIESGEAAISVNVAPEHRGRGLGAALILVACREAMQSHGVKQVRALIKPHNTASRRTFQRAGFESAPDVEVTGQRSLCMVLN